MPQIIALQRGTTTVTANGSSSATLFTQSGGLATRVIVNQLSLTYDFAADTGTVQVGVYHESFGGQTSLIGLFRRLDASSFRAVQFPVGAFTNNNWGGTPLPTGADFLATVPVLGHTQASGDMFSTSPSNINVGYSTTSNTRFSVLPSNFYIGPSDSVKIKTNFSSSSGTATATISYSFTTITET
jgi:hypothetical protein